MIGEFHGGVCGGHYAWKEIRHKILRAGFYWPKLFAHVGSKVGSCIPCDIFVGKQRLASLPLVPVLVEAHFLQWGLDFISEIVPSSSNQHKWILTTTDYFTMWVEAIIVRNTKDAIVMKFIEEFFCLDLAVQDKYL